MGVAQGPKRGNLSHFWSAPSRSHSRRKRRSHDCGFRRRSSKLTCCRIVELSWGQRHGRGMVVDDEPLLAALNEGEAVARRQALRLSILDIGKRVVAGIDCRTAVHTEELIADRDLHC